MSWFKRSHFIATWAWTLSLAMPLSTGFRTVQGLLVRGHYQRLRKFAKLSSSLPGRQVRGAERRRSRYRSCQTDREVLLRQANIRLLQLVNGRSRALNRPIPAQMPTLESWQRLQPRWRSC